MLQAAAGPLADQLVDEVLFARGAVVFVDCSPESPAGRRSLCYDRKALDGRKENKPRGSAVEEAASMGIDLLTEAQYRALQELGEFDRRTSSWIATPAPIRALGGALFCDRRYDTVFVYHNGAESYCAAFTCAMPMPTSGCRPVHTSKPTPISTASAPLHGPPKFWRWRSDGHDTWTLGYEVPTS